jgi:periplasmic copper chaperone A
MSRARTVAVTTFAVMAGLLVLAGPASAHVTVSAPGATPGGGDQQITFRVPVEENSDTVAITVAFPLNEPIASVDVVPVAGWTNTEKTVKLKKPIKTDDGPITDAVSQVTWKAEAGHGLKPGEAGLFNVLAGQLPDAHRITFKAVQTYANGDVVKWIEQSAPGSNAEPEHPAPVLKLTATRHAAAAGSTSSSSSNTVAVILSIVALVWAGIALALAVLLRRRRGEVG